MYTWRGRHGTEDHHVKGEHRNRGAGRDWFADRCVGSRCRGGWAAVRSVLAYGDPITKTSRTARRGVRSALGAVGQRDLYGVPGAAPTVPVGDDPVGVVVDPYTRTVYVANGGDGTVSVINDASCHANDLSGCGGAVVASFNADADGLTLSVDRANHTLYVGQSDTVAMVNTTTCNASNVAGCSQPFASAPVGKFPGFAAVDPATNTIDVPNINDGTVSVIDGGSCNATEQGGCRGSVTVTAGSGATQVAVDDATHTAYVANWNNGHDGTVSLIDTRTCNGIVRFGCGETFPTVAVGRGPSADVVAAASDTVYVEVGPGVDVSSVGSLELINGATCNVSDQVGCGLAPARAPDGSGPIAMAENPVTRTVYAVNEEDDDMSVIDARTCNATDHAGCEQTPPALAIGGRTTAHVTLGSDDGAGAVAVDPSTDTLYAASQAENNVSILNGATCNGVVTWGCSVFAPTTRSATPRRALPRIPRRARSTFPMATTTRSR